MQVVAHVNADIAAHVQGRSVQIRFTWLDQVGGSFVFPVTCPADTTGAAVAIANAFNSLPIAQRTRSGDVISLAAVDGFLAFTARVQDGAAPLAVLGERVSASVTTNIFTYDVVVPEAFLVSQTIGYSELDVAAAMTASAALARG